MAKIYKKENCEYIGGYIACGDEVVGVPAAIVLKLNKLDTDLQMAEHRRANTVKPVEVKPFVRKHEGVSLIELTASTPALDRKIAEAEALMDDLDSLDVTNQANDYLANLADVVDWLESDYIVESVTTSKFDLPVVGNPLDLSAGELVDMVASLF